MSRLRAVRSPSRRAVLQGAGGALAMLAVPHAFARPPLLTGTEADAIALEFVGDAARLHPSLQPRYVPGSRCATCFFFQGRRSDASGPCTVFAGWRVPASGWCREFAPRS